METPACRVCWPAVEAVVHTAVVTHWVVLAWPARVELAIPQVAVVVVRVVRRAIKPVDWGVWVHNARVARVPKTVAKPVWVAPVVAP